MKKNIIFTLKYFLFLQLPYISGFLRYLLITELNINPAVVREEFLYEFNPLEGVELHFKDGMGNGHVPLRHLYQKGMRLEFCLKQPAG